ncbi:probable arginine--tRNA ligase, cytoplasmic isoform X2 [Malaya genurostris]|nr:probable arginine--tRNA ligase, cytoplasmic isoform X2 [Malaya genurostris]
MYVVDNGQSDHFSTLVSIAQHLKLPYASNVTHVKFGRVRKMSTRKGTAVFLKDILDEAEVRMKQKLCSKQTTKINISDISGTTSILATTAVVVNDLKQRRMREYDFSWDKALQSDGDCGIKLQYTHCRLWSLEEQFGHYCIKAKCSPLLLSEKEAIDLVFEIAKFDAILIESMERKEACVLVNYLFQLCNCANRAVHTLNVKNEDCINKRIQRMILFTTARKVLYVGMKVLGLTPLLKM